MRRFVVLPLLTVPATVLLALASASPAWAHEEINPASVPTGKPVFFTLSAANEKQADLNKITLTAPQGLNFGATTKDPVGWAVNRTDTVITWTGGAVKSERFEQWGFEIEGADQPGTLTYKVTLSYADGTSDDVEVPITVHEANATDTSSTKSSGTGLATAALVLALIALAAAAAATVVGVKGRSASGGGGGGAGGSDAAAAAAGGGQDW